MSLSASKFVTTSESRHHVAMFKSTELQQPKQPLSSGCSITPVPDALAHAAVDLSAKKRKKVSKLEPQARDSQLCQRPCGQAAAQRSSTVATELRRYARARQRRDHRHESLLRNRRCAP